MQPDHPTTPTRASTAPAARAFAQSAPLVRPDTIASHLGMSERWVRQQVKVGMPHHKFGAFVRFDLAAVREWIDAQRGGSEARPPKSPSREADTWMPLMKVPDLAEQVGMSERWVREQIRLGIPRFKFGTFVRFDPLEARAWLTERYHVPPVTSAP